MEHWLADVHSGGFAPAFTLSFHGSERSRKPPLVMPPTVNGQDEKKKDVFSEQNLDLKNGKTTAI